MGDLRSDLSPDGKTWQPFPGAFYFGGGGGTNEDFAQPPYQSKAVPDALAHTVAGKRANNAMRTVPDVAFNGDLLTAVVTGHTDPTLGGYTTDEVGGTSAAAPMFAAVQAAAAQAAGGRLGFANPALYQRAGTKQFNDVIERPAGAPDPISAVVDHGTTDGAREARLYRLGADHGLSAGVGYDVATGLGSVTAEYFASYKPMVKPVPPTLPAPVPPTLPTLPTAPKPTPPQTPKPTPVPKPTPPAVPAPKLPPAVPVVKPVPPTVTAPKPGPPKG
jgi:subtilase family serine protease